MLALMRPSDIYRETIMINYDPQIRELADLIETTQKERGRDVWREYAANSLTQYLEISQPLPEVDDSVSITVRVSDHQTIRGPRNGNEWLGVRVDFGESPADLKRISRDIDRLITEEIDGYYPELLEPHQPEPEYEELTVQEPYDSAGDFGDVYFPAA